MNFTCKKCGFYFNHTNLKDIDCPICDGNYLKIEKYHEKTRLDKYNKKSIRNRTKRT